MSSDESENSFENCRTKSDDDVSESSYIPSQGRSGGCSIEVEIVKRRASTRKVNRSTQVCDIEGSPTAVRSRKKWNIRPPLVGQVSATDSEDDTQKDSRGKGGYFGKNYSTGGSLGGEEKSKSLEDDIRNKMGQAYFGAIPKHSEEMPPQNQLPAGKLVKGSENGRGLHGGNKPGISSVHTEPTGDGKNGNTKEGDCYFREIQPNFSTGGIGGASKVNSKDDSCSSRNVGDGYFGLIPPNAVPSALEGPSSSSVFLSRDVVGKNNKGGGTEKCLDFGQSMDRSQTSAGILEGQVSRRVLTGRSHTPENNSRREVLLEGDCPLSSDGDQKNHSGYSKASYPKGEEKFPDDPSSTAQIKVVVPTEKPSVSSSAGKNEKLEPSELQREWGLHGGESGRISPEWNYRPEIYPERRFRDGLPTPDDPPNSMEFLGDYKVIGSLTGTYSRKREALPDLPLSLEGAHRSSETLGERNHQRVSNLRETYLNRQDGDAPSGGYFVGTRTGEDGENVPLRDPILQKRDPLPEGGAYSKNTDYFIQSSGAEKAVGGGYPMGSKSSGGVDLPYLDKPSKIVSDLCSDKLEGGSNQLTDGGDLLSSSNRPLTIIHERLCDKPSGKTDRQKNLGERRVDYTDSEGPSSLDIQVEGYTREARRNNLRPPEGAGDGDRPPSVASVNSTSRPLEWDSGADVGYSNYPVPENLSTLERLALVRGTAGLLARSDPEGMTGNVKKAPQGSLSKVQPRAQSTPVTLSGTMKSCDSLSPIFPSHSVPSEGTSRKYNRGTLGEESGSLMNNAKHTSFNCRMREGSSSTKCKTAHKYYGKDKGGAPKESGSNNQVVSSSRPYIPLFPEVMKENDCREVTGKSCTAGEYNSRYPLFPEVIIKEPTSNLHGYSSSHDNIMNAKKLSSSLEDLKDLQEVGGAKAYQASTFPRSQSQLDIKLSGTSKPVVISNSSSSVATVVNKEIQKKSSSILKDANIFAGGDSVRISEFGTDTGSGGRTADSFEYLPGPNYPLGRDQGGHDTLSKDVQKAIGLLTEFVVKERGSANSKKRLVKDIVERLINTEYPGDSTTAGDEGDVWSSQDSPVVRQPEGSSRDETSSTSRSSLRPSQVQMANKCIGTSYPTRGSSRSQSSEWCSDSEGSKTTFGRSSSGGTGRDSGKITKSYSSHLPVNGETKKPSRKKPRESKIEESSENSRVHLGSSGGSDWRTPVTASEKHLEYRRMKDTKKKEEHNLIRYIESEKKNQLEWIRSEINHLSNLKLLLEKHQKLKNNVNSLKSTRQRIHAVGKQGNITDSSTGETKSHRRRNHPSAVKSTPAFGGGYADRLQTRDESQPTGVKGTVRPATSPGRCPLLRNTSKESGWSSHHYFESDSENGKQSFVRPCKNVAREYGMRENRLRESSSLGGHQRRVDVATATVSEVAVQTGRFPKPLAYSIDFTSTSNGEGEGSRNGSDSERERQRDGRQQQRGGHKGGGNVMISLDELHDALDRILTGEEESAPHPASSAASNQRERWPDNQPPPTRVIEGGDSSPEDQPVTLQDYLATNRPGYLMRAESRRKILAELAGLRENRADKKRELVVQAVASGYNGLNDHPSSTSLPPHPLAVKRVVSQKDMRKQTRKKYSQLNEVKNKKVDLKKKELFKTNRLMAQVFNKKLQAKTLKGQVDLSNSISIISSI